MLCFRSSKDIVLEAGSGVFTEYVGVNIGVLDAVPMDCFCVVMLENFLYKNESFVSDVSSDIFVTLIVASLVAGYGKVFLC